MEISKHYHCSASTIGRGKGRSVVAAAAYAAAERLTDLRTGLCHDYRQKSGVLYSEVMVPNGAPPWAKKRAELWNAAEKAEDASKSRRKATARTGREFRLACAHELSHEERIACLQAFANHLIDTYGVAVDFSIHAPDRHGDQRNVHAHVLTSTRTLSDAGFGGKVRELDSPITSKVHIEAIRAKWAEIENAAYARAGIAKQVDHRSYERRGQEQTPTIHLGEATTALERQGTETERGDHNRLVRLRNAIRNAAKAAYDRLRGKMHRQEKARIVREHVRAERNALRTHDPLKILAAITERRATFTVAELEAALRPTLADETTRKALVKAILRRPEIVALAERQGEPVSRYTTQEVLRQEAKGLQSARHLATDTSHAVTQASRCAVLEKNQFGSIRPEQCDAFNRATGAEGLTIIAGEAGTGKSYCLNAIRQAYEKDGKRVVGLSFTNKVIQDMQRDGFQSVRTISGALIDARKGLSTWDQNTVLMVDEAAMLSTHDMTRFLHHADAAGAKVILVGDDRQLSSAYLRGGMFGAIRDQHRELVAELAEIRRIKDHAPDAHGQRRAFNAMHEGSFREALEVFDQLGAIHWSDTQDQARHALAQQYARDLAKAAHADRRRFAFAHTNADALALNQELRDVHRARGELGSDHYLQTKDGRLPFASGDRIQFTASAYYPEDRNAGLANGVLGTVDRIEANRVTVRLDGDKADRPRVVSFAVGDNQKKGEFNAFRHGYAGTIYKGQGATVEDSYLLVSGKERAAAAYVGATRHGENLHIFTSQDALQRRPSWVEAGNGLEGLDDAQRGRAEAAYQRWAEKHPDRAQRRSLPDYVAYVQSHRTDCKPPDLDQLAARMGRPEENRAASQFVAIEAKPEAQPTTAERTRFSLLMGKAVSVFDLIHTRTERQASADVRAVHIEEAEAGGRFARMRAFWENRIAQSPELHPQSEPFLRNAPPSPSPEPRP